MRVGVKPRSRDRDHLTFFLMFMFTLFMFLTFFLNQFQGRRSRGDVSPKFLTRGMEDEFFTRYIMLFKYFNICFLIFNIKNKITATSFIVF